MTTTDANGAYHFNNLQPGQYRVVETQPSGYFSVGASAGTVNGVTDGTVTTPDIISNVVLLGGDNSIQNDFAEALPGKISGYVYYDPNNNGQKDPGEPGIAEHDGRPVRLELQLVATTTTDATGFYQFTDLMSGTYTVEEEQPAGYLDGKDSVGSVGGTLAPPDGITEHHASLGHQRHELQLRRIAAGDDLGHGPRRHERRLHLRAGRAAVGRRDRSSCSIRTTRSSPRRPPIRTANTSSPTWRRSRRTPFTRCSRPVLRVRRYASARPAARCKGSTRSSAPRSGRAQNATDYDFCVQAPASIAGMVHVDLNGDCIYEPGEPLLAGVTIQLLDSNEPGRRHDVTDQNGQYKFTGLRPGTYTVHEVQPAGYFEFGDSVGSAGGTLQGLDTIANATLGSGVNAHRLRLLRAGSGQHRRA